VIVLFYGNLRGLREAGRLFAFPTYFFVSCMGGGGLLQGRIRSVESSSIAASPAYRAELCDESGGVTLLFYGRRKIEGLDPGALVRVEGLVGERHGYLAMANPSYQILPSP
jgi:hypothetical protein